MSLGWALVTGATGGLGGALARRLAERGHDLVLVGRSAERLCSVSASLEADHPIATAQVVLDLSRPGSAEQLLSVVSDRQLDVVALAASSYAYGAYSALEVGRHDALLGCNVLSHARLLHGLLHQLDAQGHGRVLVVGSQGALLPAPGHAAYSASKAWLHQLVRSLQAERRSAPVTLTLACPGGMATPMLLQSPAWDILQHRWLVRAALLTPEQAARSMLAGLDTGQHLVIPGWLNRTIALVSCLLPPGLAVRLSVWMYRPRRGRGAG